MAEDTAKTYTAAVTVSGGNGITAGFTVSFTVNPQPAYGIALSVDGIHTFPEDGLEYEEVEPLVVTVTNTGTNPTGILEVKLSGADRGSFTVSEDQLLSLQPGASRTFTVEPKPGLADKTYTAGVQVYNEANNISGEFGLSFTVSFLLTRVSAVTAYLSKAGGGTTVDNPVPLPVKLDDGDWAALFGAINTAGKYAALDLSASAMAGTEFDPGTADTGEKYVVSLVLPDAAESTKGACWENPVFRYFTNLYEVSGVNIKTIGSVAFSGCSNLTTVSFPVVMSIGFGAFNGCTTLTSVSFPVAASIGVESFSGCTSLTSVSFPEVTSIESAAFVECSDLATVSFPEVTSIGDNAFAGCSSLTSINFPKVTSIEFYAFGSCSDLTSISFPKVTSIDFYAFYGCTGLTAVNLPASLTVTGSNPFSGCVNLTTITVDSNNPQFTARDGMLLDKAGTTLIAYPTASGTVTLSDITSIGEVAFEGCENLSSVSFPEVTSIGDGAFNGCTTLTSVSFPKVTSIGGYAFGSTGGTALTITMGNTPPMVESSMFSFVNVSKPVTVKVPAAAVSGYDSAWRDAFKGKGSDGSGDVNTDIILTIEGF
jgi:hypothetical protein